MLIIIQLEILNFDRQLMFMSVSENVTIQHTHIAKHRRLADISHAIL